MRTTVRLDDALFNLARREGTRRGVTLTALITEGLRLVLARGSSPGARRRKITLPVSRESGGTRPGINLDDSAALLDAMEERT